MREIRDGDEYTIEDSNVILIEVTPFPEPDIQIQGEPWGGNKWRKGFAPKGWRKDGRYGTD